MNTRARERARRLLALARRLLLVSAAFGIAHAQEGAQPAAKPGNSALKKAISERFQKSGNGQVRKVLKLGDIEVVLTERARYASGIETSIGTDSLVETRRAGKSIDKAEFRGLDAVGGYTGLQLPQQQPLKGHLLVKKLGNYDTRLLVIDPQGKLFNLPDGTIYVSPNEELLFAIRTTSGETPEYAVLDLKNHKIVAEGRNDAKAVEFNRASRFFREGIVYQPFVNGTKIFVVATEKDTTKTALAHDLAMNQMIRLDLGTGELTVEKRAPELSTGAMVFKEIPGRGIGWTTIR